jgi:hypothetical protein
MATPSAVARTGVSGAGPATLVLRLSIEDGEPLAGSVSADDGTCELAFSGWLGLVETLSLMRRRAKTAR